VMTPLSPHIYEASGFATLSTYASLLVPGDELMMTSNGGFPTKAIYLGLHNGNAKLYSDTPLTGTNFGMRVQRSGRRNLVGVTAEQIVSLRNPTINRGNQMCWRDVVNPTAVVESTWVTTTYTTSNQPFPCWADLIYQLNHFFDDPASDLGSTSSYVLSGNQGLGCANCVGGTLSLGASNSITYFCGSGCTLNIIDVATGLPIPIENILEISNLQLQDILSPNQYPPAPTAGVDYSVTVDVLISGNNTPIQAYFFGCQKLFEGGAIPVEQEVNEYHSSLTATPSDDIISTVCSRRPRRHSAMHGCRTTPMCA
jgi:hypothetical protein